MSSLYRRSALGRAQRDAAQFISSIEADKYIFESVIEINKAHVLMLERTGAVGRTYVRRMLRALAKLRSMPRSSKAEDVHVAVEEAVARLAGKSAAGYLQLAKSRNDQVATAIRMRLRSETLDIMDLLADLLARLQKEIREHSKTLIIGRTHMQPAEPITYGHYLMAFHDALCRDLQKLGEFYARLNLSPMGACALAGTTIPVDRGLVAALLGFDGLVENSLDAAGSRDFALEFLADMAQLAANISRLAEDFVFYMTPEVDQLRLPRELLFASSIMPQKRNPDIIELIRAKCAIPIGAFTQVATTVHSLPSGYNLDLQQVTPSIWDCCRAVQQVTRILPVVVSSVEVRPIRANATNLALTTATEVANLIVVELDFPFRLAHQIVASAAAELSRSGSDKADLWPALVLQKARERLGHRCARLENRLGQATDPLAVVARKRSVGSPSPRETLRLLAKRRISLRRIRKLQSTRRRRLALARSQLQREVRRLCR